jgi:phenylacetate-CoA ligase
MGTEAPGFSSRAYWSGRTLLEASGDARLPFRPLAEILARQERRLRAIVRHAWESVPHYRETMAAAGLEPRDIRTADDLARLPLVSGDELAAAPHRFFSRRHRPERTILLRSSGTTGRPKEVRYSKGALFTALAHGQRQREVLAHFVGRRFGYREMTARTSNSGARQLRAFYESHAWVPRRIELDRADLALELGFEEAARRLDEFRPEVLVGFGSWLGALFRWLHERGRNGHRPRVVWYGADAMAEADRELVEGAFGIPVVSTYQADEALRIAFQCEHRAGFHLCLDDVAVRVIRPDGGAAGPGETGEIVISNLTNRATVLLNYRLGDLVTVGSAACACGRTLPTIERLAGRAADLLRLPGGEVRHPSAVFHALHEVPGALRFQLVQEGIERVKLHVVVAADADWHSVRIALERKLAALVGAGAVGAVERVVELDREPGGKVRLVISKSRGAGTSREP